MKLLTYTIALDPKGTGLFPAMARMLYASWNQSGNHGDFCIITDDATQRQDHGPSNLRIINPPPGTPPYQAKAMAWEWLPWHDYDVILFVDADCLFLKPLELPEGEWDLLIQEEAGRAMDTTFYNSWLTGDEMTSCAGRRGINSGTFAVSATHFEQVSRAWKDTLATLPLRPLWRAGCDQAAWNRVVLDMEQTAKVVNFLPGTVGFPFLKGSPTKEAEATLLHFAAIGPERAFLTMFDQYFQRYSMPGYSMPGCQTC